MTTFRSEDAMQDTDTAVLTAPLDKQALARDVVRWSGEVVGLQISDPKGCEQASLLLRSIKGVRADIQRWFEPHLTAAQESKRKAEAARKGLADECERMQEPLVRAEGIVKGALLAWEQAQERLRQAEQARLQAEAQREAEARTLAAAAEMELAAVESGDDDMRAEAAAILEQPIEAPAVHVKSFVPKVQGITYRDNWKAHPEINVKALAAAVASGAAPVTFLQPNMTAINQWARATQGGQAIPGVKVINDRQIAARG